MKSMTGFGSSRGGIKEIALDVQVRSVNGRYFEFRSHLPREYLAFEADLRSLIHESVSRGTVDLYVQKRSLSLEGGKRIVVREQLASQWVQRVRALSKKLGLNNDLGASHLGQIPGVLETEEVADLAPRERDLLLGQVKKAVQQLERSRAQEGKALAKDLLKILGELGRLMVKMKAVAVSGRAALRDRVLVRLNALDVTVDPQRLAQEVLLLSERGDVAEELSRLAEHLDVCGGLLKKQGQGKRLDFYCQELLREVNTIGSKSQVVELTQTVVEAKVWVERFREQVQNVE